MLPEENLATYGKCNNPYGHGHNYIVEVTVSGHVDPGTGMVCNLVDLDGFVKEQIVDRYDHTNLNMMDEFQKLVPTTENLCVEIFDRLQKSFRPAKVERVRIEETMMNSFEYAGGRELTH